MKTKKCTKCKTVKELNTINFYQKKEGNYQSWCKSCYRTPEMNEYRRVKLKQWIKDNPEKWKSYYSKYRKNNKEKFNKSIYKWAENNVDNYVEIQKTYQRSIPPGVYCIKYKGEVVYVGATNEPIRRQNVHFSTITTKNNIGKINKLHSFLGYDKANFTFEIVEHCDINELIEKEKYYRIKLKSKENFKRIFGKIESTRVIVERLGLTTKPRYKWKK